MLTNRKADAAGALANTAAIGRFARTREQPSQEECESVKGLEPSAPPVCAQRGAREKKDARIDQNHVPG